ncbi:hypothetical protein Zmor_011072 [Zophobas morio]|uniref:Uncharacterized protein n=1 Tax=Zophobas morio TaxID=2755281 RepID=A0AA38IT17_9CUCU|nr:hypothetical protein Zmor_011072 [Zophobas morio]
MSLRDHHILKDGTTLTDTYLPSTEQLSGESQVGWLDCSLLAVSQMFEGLSNRNVSVFWINSKWTNIRNLLSYSEFAKQLLATWRVPASMYGSAFI